MSALAAQTRQATDVDWRSEAACGEHNPDLFFPSEDTPIELARVQEATAKAICQSCPVAGKCLSTALSQRMAYGVWGGLSADDRKAVLASRAGAPLVSTADPASPPLTGVSTPRRRAHGPRRARGRCTSQAAGTATVHAKAQTTPAEVSV